MRKGALLFLLAVFLLPAASLGQSEKPLTNDDILQMIEAGFDEETIIKAIEARKADFDTSIQALIALKESKVSERVIQAMLSASKVQPASPPASPPIVAPAAVQPNTISSLPSEGAIRLEESRVSGEKKPSGVQMSRAADFLGAELARDRAYYLVVESPYALVWQAIQDISRELEGTVADGSNQRIAVDQERGLTQNGSIDRDRLIGRTFGAFANEIIIQVTKLGDSQTQVGVLRRVVKAKLMYQRGTDPWERAISNGNWEKWILGRISERVRELAE